MSGGTRNTKIVKSTGQFDAIIRVSGPRLKTTGRLIDKVQSERRTSFYTVLIQIIYLRMAPLFENEDDVAKQRKLEWTYTHISLPITVR